MIVCVCHRVSDRDIAQAVQAGASCFEALQQQTRLGTCCGCCHDCAREVFDSACAGLGIGIGCSTASPHPSLA
jgi:bacterioferritin-associated ferredoxin